MVIVRQSMSWGRWMQAQERESVAYGKVRAEKGMDFAKRSFAELSVVGLDYLIQLVEQLVDPIGTASLGKIVSTPLAKLNGVARADDELV